MPPPPDSSGPPATVVTPVLPARAQPVIALAVAVGLTAGTVWFVAAGGLSGRLVHHDAAPRVDARFTVDVNAAGALELAQLPGLGPALARRIVDHRDRHGPFSAIDGLLDVPGVGPATLDAMRPHLRPVAPPPVAVPGTSAP